MNKKQLTDAKISNQLKRNNNFSDEILNNQHAFKFFRNKFYLSDQLLSQNINKTAVPIVAFYAKHNVDNTNERMMMASQQHTENWLECIGFEGDYYHPLKSETGVKMLEQITSIVESLSVKIE